MGRFADRVGPARALMAAAIAAAAGLAMLQGVSTPGPTAGLLLVWGFCSWAINPPLQSMLITQHDVASVIVEVLEITER